MVRYLLQRYTLALIWLYQKTISLDHGPLRRITGTPRCRFYPTCSEYARGAILKYGIIKGTWLTAGRLLRCNPLSKGGADEP